VPPQPNYRRDYYTRQLLYDLTWQKLNLRADHADPWLLTRPRLQCTLEFLRPLAGRESWDHFDKSDLRVAAKVLRTALSTELERLGARLSSRQGRSQAMLHHRRVMRALSAMKRPSHVLFLCYGNICRSPVAEAFARTRLAGVEVSSAGFHPNTGRASPLHICRAAGKGGEALRTRASRRVSAEDIAKADLVVCMDLENMAALQREFPQARARSTLLGLFADPPAVEIDDPFDLSDVETREVVRAIRAGVEGLRRWLDDYFLVTPTSVSGSQVASSGNAVMSAMQSTIMKKNGSEAKAT
jgi:protein-tyrosine-phosphatase